MKIEFCGAAPDFATRLRKTRSNDVSLFDELRGDLDGHGVLSVEKECGPSPDQLLGPVENAESPA